MIAPCPDEDGWDAWCLTQPPQQRAKTQRPPALPTGTTARLTSALSSRCGSSCSAHRNNEGQEMPRSTRFNVASGRSRWEEQCIQNSLSAHLSVPRRQRLVQATLEAVRGAFDPAEGLEEVAAAAANDVLTRGRSEQHERCAVLAVPREVVRSACAVRAHSAEPKSKLAVYAFNIPSLRLDALAQPRQPKLPSKDDVAASTLSARSSSSKRRRSVELCKPKAPRFDLSDFLEELNILQTGHSETPVDMEVPLCPMVRQPQYICVQGTPRTNRRHKLAAARSSSEPPVVA